MGASLVYLDEPNKEIEWDSGEDSRVTFACGEMQGWRLNMVSYWIHPAYSTNEKESLMCEKMNESTYSCERKLVVCFLVVDAVISCSWSVLKSSNEYYFMAVY